MTDTREAPRCEICIAVISYERELAALSRGESPKYCSRKCKIVAAGKRARAKKAGAK